MYVFIIDKVNFPSEEKEYSISSSGLATQVNEFSMTRDICVNTIWQSLQFPISNKDLHWSLSFLYSQGSSTGFQYIQTKAIT